MGQTRYGQSWMTRHVRDPFTKAAKRQGYRSRASFKLLDLHQKARLFHPGMRVVELGAAPGGWSQVLSPLLGKSGLLIAVDKDPMSPLPSVRFLQGDFTEKSVVDSLNTLTRGEPLDWVISDMAPALTGIAACDQGRMLTLVGSAWAFAEHSLKKGGGFLTKVFAGEALDPFLASLRPAFKQVRLVKPKGSREASREIYVLAQGYYNV